MLTKTLLQNIIKIAREAGEIILQYRKRDLNVKTKADNFDFVTDADLAAEKYILEKVTELTPDYSILSEEKGEIKRKNREYIWMIDPLDGTKNFKNGGSGFSIMIGLCHRGNPILGVVYAPEKRILYYAEKGKGAYKKQDGETTKLHISTTATLKEAILVTRIKDEEKRKEDQLIDFFHVKETLPESSVGLKCGLIAEKKADVHVNTSHKSKKWDTCAPQIILEEAGGRFTDKLGIPLNYLQKEDLWGSRSFIASNGKVHQETIETIRNYERTKKIKN